MFPGLLLPGIDTRRKPESPGACRVRGDGLGLGLTGAWVFNERGGTPRELATQKPGTLSGMTWVPGPFIQSNADADYFDTGGYTDLTYTDGTISLKVCPPFSPTDGLAHYLCGHSNGGITFHGIEIFKYSDNNIYAGWWNGSDNTRRVVIAASSANMTQNTWQTYSVVWQTSGITKLYRNGVLIGSSSVAPVKTAAGVNFRWGHENQPYVNRGISSGGKIEWGTIHKRALNPSEVMRLHTEPYSFLQPNDLPLTLNSVAAPAGTFTKLVGHGGLAGVGGIMVGPGGGLAG